MATQVQIRRYTLDDINPVFEATHESVPEVMRWMPWSSPDYSLENARTWVEGRAPAWEEKKAFEFLMVDETDRILGCCGVNRIEWVNGTANIGYWVRTSCHRQGIATKTVSLLRDWAFENTDLHRLEIVASVRNIASCRAAEKAGAVREGVLRQRLKLPGGLHDAVLYSLIKT